MDADLRDLAAADQVSGVVRVTRGGEERLAGAYGWASSAHDTAVVVLSNMEDGAWEPRERLHEAVMAGAFD